MDRKDEVLRIFSVKVREIFARLDIEYGKLQEIRMRVNAPLLCRYGGREFYISGSGAFTGNRQEAFIVDKKELSETMEYIGNYSLYAYEEEIRQGFLTIQGGHRIGVAGKAIVEGGRIKSLKYISFLNIRFAHEVKGCAESVMPYILHQGRIYNTLIISPPGCGKTTLLRDCIRQLSNGIKGNGGQTVGVVDERSEIGGCYLGVPQNDLGIRTDVLDCCPKTEGILMLVRSMAPDIIAVDEIGTEPEARALEQAMHTGCHLLATVHGNSIEDIRRKPVFEKMLGEHWIERCIVLSNRRGVGTVEHIYQENGEEVRACAS